MPDIAQETVLQRITAIKERLEKLERGLDAHMAKSKAACRNAVPKSEFVLPCARKYPMPDRSHAANAKARATQMVKRGKLSASSAAKIRANANRICWLVETLT
jgi:hypothetical protein